MRHRMLRLMLIVVLIATPLTATAAPASLESGLSSVVETVLDWFQDAVRLLDFAGDSESVPDPAPDEIGPAIEPNGGSEQAEIGAAIEPNG